METAEKNYEAAKKTIQELDEKVRALAEEVGVDGKKGNVPVMEAGGPADNGGSAIDKIRRSTRKPVMVDRGVEMEV